MALTLKCKPIQWKRISQLYKAKTHKGIDLAAPNGTSVYAVADGVVVKAGYGVLDKSYGYQVFIYHGNGYYTNYAHLKKGCLYVKAGQKVSGGQKIALSNNSGHSTGPHLHFEVWNCGNKKRSFNHRVNPKPYIDAVGTKKNYTVATKGGKLNVRSSASKNGKIIGGIPNGTEVTVNKSSAHWKYVIEYGGWVYDSYLKKKG